MQRYKKDLLPCHNYLFLCGLLIQGMKTETFHSDHIFGVQVSEY